MFFIRIALTALIGCNFFQISCAVLDTACTLLNRHENITAIKALDCYKQYEAELKEKSQKELNSCLQQMLQKPLKMKLSRPKLVALIYAGAQLSYTTCTGNIDTFISSAIHNDDIPLIHYALEQKFIDPNHHHMLIGLPTLWQCNSITMAKLLLTHGADITKKGTFKENILHHHCSNVLRNKKVANLIHFYSTVHPMLIHEIDISGKTPLLTLLDRCFGMSLDDFPSTYTLLNLGSRTDIYALQGKHCGKIPYEIVITKAKKTDDKQLKEKLFELATYIQHPTDTRSSLSQRLMDVWHDKLGA